MSLTLGRMGPFARPMPGALNVDIVTDAPAHLLYLHPVPQRVRGVLAETTVVDTRGTRMLHETGLLPVWYFPFEDVRRDLLVPSSTRTHCPFKGDASYWSIRVGDRVEEDAVWTYPEPLPSAPPIAGLVAFYVDRLDAWYEEDERILGHPRDPFHRVDTRRASGHVVVRAGGEVIAESSRPVLLFETGLPARYYLPPEDVREELLEPSDTQTTCPYKGVARYVSVRAGDTVVDDAAWSYREPLGEALQVRGYLSFLAEGIEVTVDGKPIDS